LLPTGIIFILLSNFNLYFCIIKIKLINGFLLLSSHNRIEINAKAIVVGKLKGAGEVGRSGCGQEDSISICRLYNGCGDVIGFNQLRVSSGDRLL
jgi:hypothetical protein